MVTRRPQSRLTCSRLLIAAQICCQNPAHLPQRRPMLCGRRLGDERRPENSSVTFRLLAWSRASKLKLTPIRLTIAEVRVADGCQVIVGGRRLKVIDMHAHCVIPVSEIVKGTPLVTGGTLLIATSRAKSSRRKTRGS